MLKAEIRLSTTAYSKEAVIGAAHRCTALVTPTIACDGDDWVVTLTHPNDAPIDPSVSDRFLRDALDEELRHGVRARTADLHRVLLAAALDGAQAR